VGIGTDRSRLFPSIVSFVRFWRTDGQTPSPARIRTFVIEKKWVHLRRLGFRFIALADDNSIRDPDPI